MPQTLTFLAVVVCAAIAGLANDAIGAYAARRNHFPLARLVIPTLVVYAAIGFFARVALDDLQQTMAAVVIAVVISGAAGYRIVARLGPPRPPAPAVQIAIGLLISAIVQVGIALCGATWLIYGVAEALLHHG